MPVQLVVEAQGEAGGPLRVTFYRARGLKPAALTASYPTNRSGATARPYEQG